jgi:hypothetical protein
MRKSMILGLGVLGAVVFAAWRAWSSRARAAVGEGEWENAPFPFPPVQRPAAVTSAPEPAPTLAPWVDPLDGACPATHVVKAKFASGIYHVPGGLNYERTHPDRCYLDSAAAERDGLRQSKI